ncbi:MAG TPA: ion channel [Acetobacteraceae bacterium]|nr:ion channel [Acetobacteraceae bacterium]
MPRGDDPPTRPRRRRPRLTVPRRPLPEVQIGPQVRAKRSRTRFITRSQSDAVLRVGLPANWRRDAYHYALTLPWWAFMLALSGVYLGINVIFAGLYLLQPGSIAQARPGNFWDAFFFSVETFGTIGYGVLSPATVYANALMTVEALLNIVVVAVATGLVFSRVSRPTARVLFSDAAVVTPMNGVPTLMIRIANERRNRILQAEVGMTALRNEVTTEGAFMRRFYDMPLLRSRTPVFALTFTVMHRLDETSPLYGATAESLVADDVEIVVTLTGTDETMSQTIHARTSYVAEDIRFGHRFADMFGRTPDGRSAIDFRRFDVTEKS